MPVAANPSHVVTVASEVDPELLPEGLNDGNGNSNEQTEERSKGGHFVKSVSKLTLRETPGDTVLEKGFSRLRKVLLPTTRAISQVAVGSTGNHDLIKLEVITAKEMTAVRVIQALATLYNFLFLTIVTALARGKWRNDSNCTPKSCDRSDVRVLAWYNFVSISIMCLINLFYLVYFIHVIRRLPSRRPEPYWALFLLLPMVFLVNNPLIYFDHLFLGVSIPVRNVLAGFRYLSVSLAVCAVPLYIILKAGSFVRTKNLYDPYRLKFYLVRVTPMLVIFGSFLSSEFSLRIELSPQPFVSLLSLAQSDLNFSKKATATVVSIGILHVIFLIGFVLYYVHLSRRIVKLSYRQTRLKVLNFYFFFRHTVVPIGLAVLFTTIAAVLFIQDVSAFGLQDVPNSIIEKTILNVPYFARSGIVAVYSTYAIIESYVSLPSRYRPTWLERLVIERLGFHAGGLLMPCEPSSSDERESEEDQKKEHAKDVQFTPEGRDCEASISSATAADALVPFVWGGDSAADSKGQLYKKRSTKLRMNESVLMFNMSWLVYLKDEIIDAALKDEDHAEFTLRKIWREQTRDLVVLTVESRDKLIVSFRGTVSTANWKINLLLSQACHQPLVDPEWLQKQWKPPAWGAKRPRVHKGFHDAYESLRHEVLSDIQSCLEDGNPRRVFCTGHSLGGAMATLCAFDCRVDLGIPEERVSLVTFGSPKIGNRAFTRRFAVAVPDTFRFVNHSDIVTNIPKSLVHVYEHVPRGVLIDTFGNLIVDPMYADLKLFHGSQLTPHLMQSYRDSVQSFIDAAKESEYNANWWDFTKYDGGQDAVAEASEDMKRVGKELIEDEIERLSNDATGVVHEHDTEVRPMHHEADAGRASTPVNSRNRTAPPSPSIPSICSTPRVSNTAPPSPTRERSRLKKIATSGRNFLGQTSPFTDLDAGSQGLLGATAYSSGNLAAPRQVSSYMRLRSNRPPPAGDASIRLHTLLLESPE